MKFSILSSAVIVVITAVIAVLQGGRLSELTEEQETLETRAVALGLSIDGAPAAKSELEAAARGGSSSSAGSGKQGGRTQSGSTPADPRKAAEEFANELFALATRMKELQKAGEAPPPELERQLVGFLARFMQLDPEVIPHLITLVRNNDSFAEQEKQGIMMLSLASMAKASPEAALNLYINSRELLGDEARQAVTMALGNWAGQDPRAALAWIDRHFEDLPEDATEGARALAIANAYKSDPTFAVEKTLALEKDGVLQLTQMLGRVLPTPEEQLTLLRKIEGGLGELPTDPNGINEEAIKTATNDQVLRGGLIIGLGGALARQSFESASEFLDSANLTPIETIIVAKGVAGNVRELREPGKWINWLDENSPPAERGQSTAQLVKQWTERDFRATADWIGQQPQGDLRNRATFSFAETVAPHEPDAAADWALTLPPTPERSVLLKEIHTHWQGKDADAAAAFAAKHGIE